MRGYSHLQNGIYGTVARRTGSTNDLVYLVVIKLSILRSLLPSLCYTEEYSTQTVISAFKADSGTEFGTGETLRFQAQIDTRSLTTSVGIAY